MNNVYQEIDQCFDQAGQDYAPAVNVPDTYVADTYVADTPVISLPEHPLKVYSSTELTERCFERREFWVNSLLCSGLTVLAGAPKVGKSRLNEETGLQIRPNHLKRLMNLYRFELEDHGVSFKSFREKNQRRLKVTYVERSVR